MSCHNIGFSVHNPDDLARALAKMHLMCSDCGDLEQLDCNGARVLDDMIWFKTFCVRCDKFRGRSIRFYNPHDTYPELNPS